VTKAFHLEIRRKLAIDPVQQVEVELRCHAPGISVGSIESGLVFLEVHADQQDPGCPRHLARLLKKVSASAGVKLPMVEPGKNTAFLRIGTPANSGNTRGRVWSAQMPTILRKGKRRASSFDEARSVSIAMSIGTYNCVCSAWIRMRVLACAPLPNSISWPQADELRDLRDVAAEDRHLGARQVVLGQLADRFEQAAACSS